MTRVYNTERGFKDEYVDGLVAAYSRYLRRVPDASGVMSVSAPSHGRVSVVIGGGSGHYPAFAGLVGPGLCDGAIIGDIFTSPSAEQAYRCIRALDGGAGVLLSFGNYSGDVMNFGLAVQRARAEGIDARIVLVTDDVASAPVQRRTARRGIAGGFFVFRAAAAAAHEGRTIDDVEGVARRVSDATFSFGVAFSGCTFPGRSEPLFAIAADRIALGLGIHGEPGIDTIDWMPAAQLAAVLVRPILAERPRGAARAKVLLNGLGATKYEELFVLYSTVSRLLAAEGVDVVDPEVGEYVTSLDMAGCSLSLCWLDDEIERLIAAPASAPGFRSSGPPAAAPAPFQPRDDRPVATPDRGLEAPAAKPETALARAIADAFVRMATAIAVVELELGRLDSVAGDGDHGAGMVRGMSAAAAAAAAAGPSASEVLKSAGSAFSDAAGGASGALWGAGLLAAGEAAAGLQGPAREALERSPDIASIHRLLVAALEAISRLGGAAPGDKTMVDALVPFVAEFGASTGRSVSEAWAASATAAERAASATSGMASRLGRAAVHGARSRGTPDPGAVSMAVALKAACRSQLKEDQR
ncbi:MAG: dihydroxyacetone kinase family protein [Candidatus Limnocylindrales bacterium]